MSYPFWFFSQVGFKPLLIRFESFVAASIKTSLTQVGHCPIGCGAEQGLVLTVTHGTYRKPSVAIVEANLLETRVEDEVPRAV